MKKCDKYESFYLFKDEKALYEHLNECEYCRKINEEHQKISYLIKEVKPYLKSNNKSNNFLKIKAVAAITLVIMSFYFINNIQTEKISLIKSTDEVQSFKKDISIIESMGLPTDEYGLLEVE